MTFSPKRPAGRQASAGPGPCRLLAAVLTLSLAASVAVAQESHEGTPIAFDKQLTLHDLAAAARARHPDLGVLGAQQHRASTEEDFASRWFPDSSLLSGYHLSDSALDDTGLYEDEIALSLPLWMPGERKSRSRLAEALSASTASSEAAFDWRVSSELREALWKLLAARRQWELAGEQEAHLEKVLEQAVIFEEAGEISRGDRLAVLQELATWKAETLSLEAAYQDAARMYRALTGAGALPAVCTEELSEATEIRDSHPALQVAQDRLREVSAMLDALRQGNTFRPSLQLFWRGQRADQASSQVSSVGIGFELPLGRSPSRDPELALLNEALAHAEAQYLRQRRELGLQLHEAEHTLHTIEQQLANSTQLMAAAEERRGLDQLALELGEISMQEWLRRLSDYKTIQRSHELLLVQQGAAVAAYNQAVGESL